MVGGIYLYIIILFAFAIEKNHIDFASEYMYMDSRGYTSKLLDISQELCHYTLFESHESSRSGTDLPNSSDTNDSDEILCTSLIIKKMK